MNYREGATKKTQPFFILTLIRTVRICKLGTRPPPTRWRWLVLVGLFIVQLFQSYLEQNLDCMHCAWIFILLKEFKYKIRGLFIFFSARLWHCTSEIQMRSHQRALTEKSTVQVLGYPGMPGLNRHIVSKWLKSFPSEQTAWREKDERRAIQKTVIARLRKRRDRPKSHVSKIFTWQQWVCFNSVFKQARLGVFENRTMETGKRTYFDEMRANVGDHGRVPLHHRGKPHLQLCLRVACSLHYRLGLFTPRDEVLVVVHVGYDVIHLLHRVPEEENSTWQLDTLLYRNLHVFKTDQWVSLYREFTQIPRAMHRIRRRFPCLKLREIWEQGRTRACAFKYHPSKEITKREFIRSV